MICLAVLNQMETWGTDISSAYLEALTKEKLFFKAGPEFRNLEGHTLLVHKALYGLHTSGVHWHERLADCLQGMGFMPCKVDPDIWTRDRHILAHMWTIWPLQVDCVYTDMAVQFQTQRNWSDLIPPGMQLCM